MAFRPRLLTMSQLPAQQLRLSAPPPPPISPATFAQNCVICNGRRNLRKLFGTPLRILREKGIVVENLEAGCKTVCHFCSIKLKKIFTYQRKIKSLEHKILEAVDELRVKANWRSKFQLIRDGRSNYKIQVETILDNSDGDEVEFASRTEVQNVDPFLDNSQTMTNEQPSDENQQQKLTSEDVVMEIELPHLADEPDSLINVPDPNQLEIELVIKYEFEPEDVEVMPLQIQNIDFSSSPQLQNPGSSAPLRQVKNSSKTNLSAFHKSLQRLKSSPPRIKEDARVICPQCKVFFDGQLSLERHFKYSPKHVGSEAIKRCDACALDFPSLSNRIDHDQLKHPQMFARSRDSITIKCGACGAQFYSEDGYNKHLTSEVRYPGCGGERCPQDFRTLEELREHERDAHGMAFDPEKRKRAKERGQ